MRHVLITGVSSGIGYAIAKYLLQKGYFIFGSVRSLSDADKLKSEFPSNFEPLMFDLLKKDSIIKSRPFLEKILGDSKLDAIINNAGISVHGPLKYLPIEDIQKQFDINVIGTLMVTQTFMDLLKSDRTNPSGRGSIINISSISGLFTTPFLTPYCASKHALESISKGLRRELMPIGINVVSVQPGPVDTEIWDKAQRDERNYEGTVYGPLFEEKQKIINSIRLKTIKTEVVSRMVYRILEKRVPKRNYVITRLSFYYLLQRYMPERFIDQFYKLAFRKI